MLVGNLGGVVVGAVAGWARLGHHAGHCRHFERSELEKEITRTTDDEKVVRENLRILERAVPTIYHYGSTCSDLVFSTTGPPFAITTISSM